MVPAMVQLSFSRNMNHPDLISCLCVTEGRPEFMPWVLWCFDRQTWPQRELVIVDSSPDPFRAQGRNDCRVIPAPPGTGIAAKRNIAMGEARGDIFTWFDDDDWQHPEKLTRLYGALKGGAVYAGACQGWFFDLNGQRSARFRTPGGRIIFNSAGFRKEAAMPFLFPETLERASDTPWMQNIASAYPGRVLKNDTLFFWLCHGKNISNPANRRVFPDPPNLLRQAVGAAAWDDTDQALDSLRERLAGTYRSLPEPLPSKTAPAALPGLPGKAANPPDKGLDDEMDKKTSPPVGLMIKATVMDVPFMNVTVRHIVSQARYPFAEKAIIVDRNPAFTGKYRSRPRSSDQELDQIVEKLLADGTVDTVRDVDTSTDAVRRVMARFFGKYAPGVPLHALTGGPIYATLFGMESMPGNYVLQTDADLFFHTGEQSWITQSLAIMDHDSGLWLMMTHPGPPAGPPGKSLGPANARLAKWDPKAGIWRFPTATTRYFLCDRRKLYGRLKPIFNGNRCMPLERIISDALERHGAFRGALGNLESWHLHAWHHGNPFPEWAPALAKSIKAGHYPVIQRGEYDLRLDRIRDCREWGMVLKRFRPGPPVRPDKHPRHDNSAKSGTLARLPKALEAGPVPITVIIPVRNRSGRLRNALQGLNWQSAGRPLLILVVSYGSQPGIDAELKEICAANGATLMCAGDPGLPWNKPLALNMGIRASPPEARFLMTMDADMILAPNFFSVVLDTFIRTPQSFVLCRSSDLPGEIPPLTRKHALENRFDQLRRSATLRPSWGTGGIQAGPRCFFFDVRGYDEDLLWWGAMDTDMMQRAVLAGLDVRWIEERTTMLHQWHPRKHTVLDDPKEVAQARTAWKRNHEIVKQRSGQLVRNPGPWGGASAEDTVGIRDLGKNLKIDEGLEIRVLITTFNRPSSLIRLLRQLDESAVCFSKGNKGERPITVDIMNDGGETVHVPVLPNLQCNYSEEDRNNGKQGYWRLIDKAYSRMKTCRFDLFIQLPDDVEVEPSFFNDAVDQWMKIQDPGKISLNLLLDQSRIGRPNWTNVFPCIKSFNGCRFFLTGWIDMCFISGRRFFNALEYRIDPVPPSRWHADPNMSSGVGQQISGRLYAKGLNMYQVRESLLFHGNHQSRMNPGERAKTPLISFKLDEIHCGLASYPARINALEQAVESIIGQVDFLHVYLNDYNEIPRFLKKNKIGVYLSGEHSGNLGDAGKFFKSGQTRGYYLSIDDDLVYPKDYVWRIVRRIEHYGRLAVVGVHGKIMKPEVRSFYRDKAVFHHCLTGLKKDQIVHVLGTGTTGFHTDTIRVSARDFKRPNMADVWLAILGQQQNKPFIAIAREKNWLKHIQLKNPNDTIYKNNENTDSVITGIFNEVRDWRLNYLPDRN